MEESVSDFLLSNMRLCHEGTKPVASGSSAGVLGWDRATKRLWPTLSRQSSDEAWGFSLALGSDIGDNSAHWSGVVASRHDRGIWAKVWRILFIIIIVLLAQHIPVVGFIANCCYAGVVIVIVFVIAITLSLVIVIAVTAVFVFVFAFVVLICYCWC